MITLLSILLLISLMVFFVPGKLKYPLTFITIFAGGMVSFWEALRVCLTSVNKIEFASYNIRIFDQPAYASMDMLTAVFVLIVSIVGISVLIYARDYVKHYVKSKSPAQISLHYCALSVLFFSMLGVVIFQGGYSFMIAWELMTVSSFVLVFFDAEKRVVRRAAIYYLMQMHIAFVLILIGFLLGAGNTPDEWGFTYLPEYFKGSNPLPVFILFFLGFGMKAGIFPLHIWLPEAHPAAPSHVSALMSGVMLKMGVYGIIRVLTFIDTQLLTIGIIIFVTGIVTSLWGIFMAAVQNDLKKLLAYSSMDNIGIILIAVGAAVIGLGTGNNTIFILGMGGALMHVVNHSMFKALLFMGAGSIYLSTHTRNINELGGLIKRMPLSTVLFIVGTVAICALPPMNGFISEFIIYSGFFSSISTGDSIIVSLFGISVLALVGGMTVFVFIKALGLSFLGEPRCCKSEKAKEVSGMMLNAQVVPVAMILLLAFFPEVFFNTISQVVCRSFSQNQILTPDFISSGFFKIPLISFITLITITLLYNLKSAVNKKRNAGVSDVWGCGFTNPSAKMQYTGESFSENLDLVNLKKNKE